MFETSKGQFKLLLISIGVLLIILLGLVSYVLYLSDKLPFITKPPAPTPSTNTSFLDTSRIDNCIAESGTDPIIETSTEVVPGIMELDFRGKVLQVSPGSEKTKVKLTSLGGDQAYELEIDNTEPVNGKNTKLTLSELKYLDELLIAVNCKKGEKGTFKFSKIYKVEK
jgi:hypothetical protein